MGKREGRRMVKTKKAGILTKIVVLGLLVYLATVLLSLNGQIAAAEAERDTVRQQVAAQTQRNADLAEDVAQADDPAKQEEIAQEKLDLVFPGEKVFIDVTN